jgi:chitodextrinase
VDIKGLDDMTYIKSAKKVKPSEGNSEDDAQSLRSARQTSCRIPRHYIGLSIFKVMICLAAFSAMLGISSTRSPAQSPANQASPLGTNLARVGYYSSEEPFLNLFKTGGGWWTYNASGPTGEEVLLYTSFLDGNGYPTTLTGGPAHAFTALETLVFRNFNSSDVADPTYQAGDYLLQWTGSGTFAYGDDPGNGTCSTSPCKITVNSPSSNGILITLTSTGVGSNYAQNISLIYCGTWNGSSCSNGYDSLLANGEIFNPNFIARISQFKTLRFMDWMATTVNFQKNWSDRPLPGWVFWDDSRTNATLNGAAPYGSNDGVPAEVMFALCNKLQADCWFNMPPLATDDYVTQFAALAHSMLNSTLKVYVEYANELWNQNLCQPSGTMTQSCIQQVSALCAAAEGAACPYPTSFSTYQANTTYGAVRAVQVGAIWRSVWGADSRRVIRVFGGWNGNTGYHSYWLPWTDPAGHFSGTIAQNVDVLAVAPYFGYSVPDAFTLDQLFTEIMSGGLVSSGGYPGGMIKQTLDWAATNYSMATSAGLGFVAYEGGQSLVDYSGSDAALQTLYAAANRDSRMGTAYTTLLSGWKSLGGTLFINYSDIQQYSKWGYWGALENVLETSSPKYNALMSFITNNPCWWNGCGAVQIPPTTTGPSIPSGLVGSALSSTQIGLAWNASTDTAATVAGYNVYRNGQKVGAASNTSYQDSGLSSGTAYQYSVSAYDTSGKTSAQSPAITVSTPAPPPSPPSVAINSPANGATIRNNGAINIASSAVSTNSRIVSIAITVDRNQLLTCANTTTCSATWPGKSVSMGTHTIGATATDANGSQASTSIIITDLK